jgi:CheY-like chemotaxis protein
MPTSKILIVESDPVRGEVLTLLLGQIGFYSSKHVRTKVDALKESSS